MANRITVGNATVKGFVNHVAAGRLVVGTGSYEGKDGKVFKESVTVFLDEKFDGKVPEKGDYVKIEGDLSIAPRRDNADQLNATFNVRFKNQLEKIDAPKAKSSEPAAEGAGRDI